MEQALLKQTAMLTLCTALLAAPLPCRADHLITQSGGEIGILGGSVSRSAFTEAVVNSEPKSRLIELPNNKQFLYYFTELKGMAGQTITHRWLFNGATISDKKFNIGAPRWRIWSNLTLNNEWLGEWKVQVIDEMERVIHSDSFNYVQTSASARKQ